MVRLSSQSKSMPVSAVAEYSPIGMCTRPNVMAPFHSVRVEVGAMPRVSAFAAIAAAAHQQATQALHQRRLRFALQPVGARVPARAQAREAQAAVLGEA